MKTKKQSREVTSKRVAKIAGKVLASIIPDKPRATVYVWTGVGFYGPICTVGELKALAASCLTQRESGE